MSIGYIGTKDGLPIKQSFLISKNKVVCLTDFSIELCIFEDLDANSEDNQKLLEAEIGCKSRASYVIGNLEKEKNVIFSKIYFSNPSTIFAIKETTLSLEDN